MLLAATQRQWKAIEPGEGGAAEPSLRWKTTRQPTETLKVLLRNLSGNSQENIN